jgi:tripartite-type tricarboxylate transporter receptor subunit TctC
MPQGLQRRRIIQAVGAAALGTAGLTSRADSFPTKPIRVLIGVPAGGTQDVLTRAIADYLRTSLGTIIIDNRGGASGRIAVDVVKNAEPDGHTLLLGTAGMMTMFPNFYKNLSYDPINDFAPIINAASFELAMVVNSSVPVNNLAEFIAWAKANPNKLSFASYGAGTPSHFLGEMLNRAAGINMTHIPYRGSTPARQDVMGGTVPVYFDTVGGAISMQPSGRIKVLATSGTRRSPPMPGVPTFVELGHRDVVASAWFSYYAPRKTPKPVLDKLRAEFARAVNSREVRQQLLLNGMYPVGDGPDELIKTMKLDTARWGQVVKATGFVATE